MVAEIDFYWLLAFDRSFRLGDVIHSELESVEVKRVCMFSRKRQHES